MMKAMRKSENNYAFKAVIATGDGDFTCLVRHLYSKDKLGCLLVPNENRCSWLFKKTAKEKWISMEGLEKKLAYPK